MLFKYIKKPMKTIQIRKSFAGYGHYKLTATVEGVEYSTTTSSMPLIDRMNSDDDGEAVQANIEAIILVLHEHEIEYGEINVSYDSRFGTIYSAEI